MKSLPPKTNIIPGKIVDDEISFKEMAPFLVSFRYFSRGVHFARWWFQTFVIFAPTWGDDQI